jgi:NAD(P)-dependent dehydrogenase (short-subunit alcohol dehydrogenase family)
MAGEFAGKVAAVTGAARGIGDAIAVRFIEEGARVFSLDLGDPDEPRAGVTYLKADVGKPESVAAAFAAIDREAGRIDVLVNNAGVQRVALAENMSPADWQLVLNTHLTGMHLCCAEAIRRMRAQGKGGAIVSIASAAGIVGIPGRGPYSAAKAGIEGLTRV